MKPTLFTGIATALITPMTPAGVDYDNLARVIDFQIDEGIDALVICGTTGESSTLSDAEHRAVIEFAVQQVAHRVPVIAGTGSNDTAYAIALTQAARAAGADGALVVTPYYNKATQAGLVGMYTAIATQGGLPLLIYNVPSRTGVNVEPQTYAQLAQVPNIVGIKEANGNLSKIMETFALVGDKLAIYSGNDDQIVPFLAMGGKGCISVLSNVLPCETCEIPKRFFAGDLQGAAKLQSRYHELIAALFCEVNPIPVKAAMAMRGYCENYLRLPLTPMEAANAVRLQQALRALDVEV